MTPTAQSLMLATTSLVVAPLVASMTSCAISFLFIVLQSLRVRPALPAPSVLTKLLEAGARPAVKAGLVRVRRKVASVRMRSKDARI